LLPFIAATRRRLSSDGYSIESRDQKQAIRTGKLESSGRGRKAYQRINILVPYRCNQMEKHGADRFEVRITSDSHFGWMRTRMALERTQMAWVRTGTSLIAFGFTIYQVLSRLPENALHAHAARDLGLILIGTGIAAMVLAVLDYRSVSDYMWSPEYRPIAGLSDTRAHSRVLPVTLIVLAVGIFAFVIVVLRVP
jgi:putative membrane protein